ncbi:MAG: hypothetical protein V1767_00960 [Chloroflexota bacterium]
MSAELRLLENAVYFHPTLGAPGTDYPIGTRQYPVNNGIDLRAILAARGLNTVVLLDSWALDADMVGVRFTSEQDFGAPTLTLGGFVISYADRLVITGDGGGAAFRLTDCDVTALTNVFFPLMINCRIFNVTMSGAGGRLEAYNCTFENVPFLDFNASSGFIQNAKAPRLSVRNVVTGGLLTVIDMDGGILTLEATCTAGTINVFGNCELVNLTAGATVNDYRDKAYATALIDGVHVDSVLGAAGTAYPLGTPEHPVSNLTDALVIAAAFNTRIIRLHGAVTYTIAAHLTQQYVFIGDGKLSTVLFMNFKNMVGSCFENIKLTGQQNDNVAITATNCYVQAAFTGNVYDSIIGPSSGIGGMNGCNFYNCHAEVGCTFTVWNSNNNSFVGLSGELTISNQVNANNTRIDGVSLFLTIAASMTTGTLYLYGNISQLINLTGGTVVYDRTDSAKINNLLSPPIPALIEVWQSELGMPEANMEWTHPLTGTPWTVQTNGIYREFYTAPAASENARLVGKNLWMVAPGSYGTNTIYKKIILEYVIRLTTLANFDNGSTIWGMTPNKTDTRLSNNVLGFVLLADVLQALTDNGGAETVTAIPGAVLTIANKLGIEIYAGHIKFFVNEVQVADHTVNLPNAPMYRNIYLLNEAGGATGFGLMGNEMHAETIVRN